MKSAYIKLFTKIFITTFTAAVLLTGCSSHYSLSYEPSLDTPVRRSAHLSVSVQDPETQEDNQKPKGIVIGQIGPDQVSQWFSEALIGELQRVGYHIKTSEQDSQYQIIIGKLDTIDGKMALEISLKDQDEWVLIKKYSSTKPTSFPLYKAFFGIQRPLNKLMNACLQDIYEQFIHDLNQVIQD